jgi:NADPH:quinone reductase-like Zn-dependent oxidoreductase
LVRQLGADHVIDHETTDFTQGGERYDVIFDIAGVTSFGQSRSCLTDDGRYLTLYLSVGVLLQMALTSMVSGPKAKFAVAMGDRKDMDQLRELIEQGVIHPVIAQRFTLEHIAEAHAEAETTRAHGAVVVTLAPSRAHAAE